MRVSDEPEIAQVVECQARAPELEPAGSNGATQHGEHFKLDEMRCMKVGIACEPSTSNIARVRVIGHRVH